MACTHNTSSHSSTLQKFNFLKWIGFIFVFIWANSTVSLADPNPNFVLIVIDDGAFMDLGFSGGEAKTPHMDNLAERGAFFTNYRTTPLCAPSRAMLLTGLDNHRTGVATIPEVLPVEQEGKEGYTMHLEPGVMTVAERLRREGYRTIMTGKWHLGSGEGDLPNSHGFESSFALDASGADNWEDRSYIPYYAEAPWFENGESADLPQDFYSSEFIVEKAIEYLDLAQYRNDPRPFFAFLGFQAIHIPVQAPKEFIDNYRDTYRDGWDAHLDRRWKKAVELGFVSDKHPKPVLFEGARDWDALPDDKKELFAARMAANAGMIEAMDHYIGKFIQYLKDRSKFENTVFIVVSDNGPEFNDVDNPALTPWRLMQGYRTGLKNLGQKGSYLSIGPEFANASAVPGSLFKFYSSEGGLHVPLVISGPGIPANTRFSARSIASDITPTILDLIDAPKELPGFKSMDGRSLLPILKNEVDEVYGDDEPIVFEVSGNAAVYKGDYKLMRNFPPYGDTKWRLYNLANDPAERIDLTANMPALVNELKKDYANYSVRVGVLEVPPGYVSLLELRRKMRVAIFVNNRTEIILSILLLIAVIVAAWKWRKRANR